MEYTDIIKTRIDEIAPEVFRLQDTRRDNTISDEDRKRLESMEREYHELMGKLAEDTVERLKNSKRD